jgi:hypothetical protein
MFVGKRASEPQSLFNIESPSDLYMAVLVYTPGIQEGRPTACDVFLVHWELQNLVTTSRAQSRLYFGTASAVRSRRPVRFRTRSGMRVPDAHVSSLSM